jgi:hypothetical protein
VKKGDFMVSAEGDINLSGKSITLKAGRSSLTISDSGITIRVGKIASAMANTWDTQMIFSPVDGITMMGTHLKMVSIFDFLLSDGYGGVLKSNMGVPRLLGKDIKIQTVPGKSYYNSAITQVVGAGFNLATMGAGSVMDTLVYSGTIDKSLGLSGLDASAKAVAAVVQSLCSLIVPTAEDYYDANRNFEGTAYDDLFKDRKRVAQAGGLSDEEAEKWARNATKQKKLYDKQEKKDARTNTIMEGGYTDTVGALVGAVELLQKVFIAIGDVINITVDDISALIWSKDSAVPANASIITRDWCFMALSLLEAGAVDIAAMALGISGKKTGALMQHMQAGNLFVFSGDTLKTLTEKAENNQTPLAGSVGWNKFAAGLGDHAGKIGKGIGVVKPVVTVIMKSVDKWAEMDETLKEL